nr:hypothetical protein P409_34 [uncultured proteobacterium]
MPETMCVGCADGRSTATVASRAQRGGACRDGRMAAR